MVTELQSSIDNISDSFTKVGNLNSIGDIVGVIVNILLGVTFGISIIGIAYGFFQFVLSRGDKDAVAKARLTITWSVVALVMAFLVVAFKSILYQLIGIGVKYEEVNPQF